MAMQWIDGFDHYGSSTAFMDDGAWAAIGTSSITTGARTGAKCFQITGLSGARRVLQSVPVNTLGIGFALFMPTQSNSNYVGGFNVADTGNNALMKVTADTTGRVVIGYYTGGTTFVASATTALPILVTAAYQHVECSFTVDGAGNGACEVRINEVTVLTATGMPMPNNNLIAQTTIGGLGNVLDLFDDMYCWDGTGLTNNTFLGDRRVYTLFPSANESPQVWSPLSGAAYASINEQSPNDDTSYIAAAPSGSPQSSQFAFDDLPGTVTSVSAVMLYHRSKKTDAGTCNVQTTMVSGAATANGLDRTIATAYTYYADAFDVDPNTAAPWLPSAVNAVSARITRTL